MMPRVGLLLQSHLIDRLSCGLLLAMVAMVSLSYELAEQPGTDFEIFLTVGRLHAAGEIALAYDRDFMQQKILSLTSNASRVAWGYPPPFTAITVLLAAMPRGLAMALFQCLSLLLLLRVLKALSPQATTLPLACGFPAVFQNVMYGQNGALTAGLIGAGCLLLLRNRAAAGVPLGLMVIKPHLVAVLSLLPVLERRIATLAASLVTVLLACLLSTWLLGPDIWPAFVASIGATTDALREGQFPLHRMTSLYASAAVMGADYPAALTIQLAGAALGLAAFVHAVHRRWAGHRTLAVGLLASLLLSPYLYDYDMALLAVAVALLTGDLPSAASRGEQVLLVSLCWLVPLFGLIQAAPLVYEVLVHDVDVDFRTWIDGRITLAGPLLLVLFGLVLRIAQRAEAAGQQRPTPAAT